MKRLRHRWLGSILVLGATLGLLEAALRLFLGGAEQARLYQFNRFTEPCVSLRPNSQVDYTGWFLRIEPVKQEVNGLGFRGPGRPYAKPPTTFRIAAVGDSYTYGMGVAEGESIPARLEEVLARRGANGVEVLNFGVPGASLDDSIERLQYFIFRWRPNLVLFFLYGDDLNASFCSFANPSAVIIAPLASSSYVARTVLTAYRMVEQWVVARRSGGGTWPQELGRGLQRLHDSSARMGARLAIVVLGDPSGLARSSNLTGAMAALGDVPWLDGRVWLYGETKERLPTIYGESHFDPEGNRAAAQRVATWLLDRGLVR